MLQFAVISMLVLAYCLVMLLFWRIANQQEHLRSRVETIARMGQADEQDASELSQPFTERFLKPLVQGLMKRLESLMPQTENPQLALNLKMAGYRASTAEYNVYRLMAVLVALIIGGLLGTAMGGATGAFYIAPIGAAAALVVLRFLLKSSIKNRKFAIQKQLPEVLDLLSVSVEAGLGFDAALQRVAERAKGPLINELNATYREITLGRPRAEALRNFEQRCGLEEIKSFVGAIIQAEQLGISLKNVLKTQAQQMRLLKRQRVEEKAMKAPVKIIFPLVVFVFPVLFIILLGPAILSIINMQGMFGG